MRKNITAIAATLFLILGCAAAQAQSNTGLHLEACTEWREFDGNLYTRNVCNRTVVVQFMTLDKGELVERRLERNEPFDTGIRSADAKQRGWIGSTCPVGFRPDVALNSENRQRFFDSSYDCVPR
jgi:hypothetical protein